MDESQEKLYQLIAITAGIDVKEIEPGLKFDSKKLKFDELDIIEIIMHMEEEFGIEAPDEEIEKLSTVGELEKYIDKKIKEQDKSSRLV